MTDIVWVISSCALILAVIVLRAVFGKKLSAGLRYALWGIVLARLLIPGAFASSPFSIKTAVQNAGVVQYAETVKDYSAIAQTESGIVVGRLKNPSAQSELNIVPMGQAAGMQPNNDPRAEPGQADSAGVQTAVICQKATPELFERLQKTLTLREILNVVWLTGAGIAAAYFIIANLRFYFKLRARRVRLDINAPCPVYSVRGLSSSCLLINSIYISEETAHDEQRLAYVLEHEKAHRRHGDGILAILRSAALTVHWYNPLVWAAAFLSRRDSEQFADSGAIKALGEDEREAYGRALIELSSGASVSEPIARVATMMTSSGRELKARVGSIASRRGRSATAAAIAGVLALAAVGGSFLGAEKTSALGAEPAYCVDYSSLNYSSRPTAASIVETDDTLYCLKDHVLYVTDKQVKQWKPLCSKPGCRHRDAGCDAFINARLLVLYDKNLYFVQNSGYRVLKANGSGGPRMTLCRMSLDGSVCESLCDLYGLLTPEQIGAPESVQFDVQGSNKYLIISETFCTSSGMSGTIKQCCYFAVDLQAMQFRPILTEYGGVTQNEFTLLAGSGSHVYGRVGRSAEQNGIIVDVDLASGSTRKLCDINGRLAFWERGVGVVDGKLYYTLVDFSEEERQYTEKDLMHLYSLDLKTGALKLEEEETVFGAKWCILDDKASYWYRTNYSPGEQNGTYICGLDREPVGFIPVSDYPEEAGGRLTIGRITNDYIFAAGSFGNAAEGGVLPVWYLNKADIGSESLCWRRWEPDASAP